MVLTLLVLCEHTTDIPPVGPTVGGVVEGVVGGVVGGVFFVTIVGTLIIAVLVVVFVHKRKTVTGTYVRICGLCENC